MPGVVRGHRIDLVVVAGQSTRGMGPAPEVRAVGQAAQVGLQFRQEPIERTPPRGLERPRGHGQIGGQREPADVHPAGGIDRDVIGTHEVVSAEDIGVHDVTGWIELRDERCSGADVRGEDRVLEREVR